MKKNTHKPVSKRRRPENSGRPRFTEGRVVKAMILLSERQYDYLTSTGNLSAEVRRLIDEAQAA